MSQCGDVTGPAPGNRVFFFHSADNGDTWTKPRSIYPEDGNAVYITEVSEYKGVIRAFLTVHSGKFLDMKCVVMESRDSGYTWENIGSPPFFDTFTYMRGLIVLRDGTLLQTYQHYPISGEENARLKSMPGIKGVWDSDIKYVESGVLLSADEGKNRTKGGHVRTPLKQQGAPNWAWDRAEGRLMMLLRICGSGKLWRTESADGGRTWSGDIPNPSNKPKLIRLDERCVALIHTPNPNTGSRNRFPLEIWISDDRLKTWGYKHTVSNFPGSYDYPDGIAEKDGKVMRFTIEFNRKEILFVEHIIND
ncbi:MAG: exo-alpha-sialidase [Eubacteriales bacterium]|nr:exo-alpha-sialidase [Eubacteriales bacterium]